MRNMVTDAGYIDLRTKNQLQRNILFEQWPIFEPDGAFEKLIRKCRQELRGLKLRIIAIFACRGVLLVRLVNPGMSHVGDFRQKR